MAAQYKSKALEVFAGLVLDKIQQVNKDWKKPWITSPVGFPRNAITGRMYSGFNNLMLFFETERKGYSMPAFLTYKQTQDAGAYVLKGQRSFPVTYWHFYYAEKNNPSKTITREEFSKLSESDKTNYNKKFFLKDYAVFNIDQTSIRTDKPELYKKIKSKFNFIQLNDENGMIKLPILDEMLANKSWLCDINVKESNRAFYSVTDDYITVPLKSQFEDGEKFYSTLLHEMTHSTGAESRLDRKFGFFATPEYGKEELIAEFTAALTAATLNMSTTIQEHNAQYLKGWLETIKEQPSFILTLLSDVNKAYNLISDTIGIDENIEAKVIQSHKEDFAPVEFVQPELNTYSLEKGNTYLLGDRQVIFTGVAAGGIFNFKYPDSGKTVQLISEGKPPKGIRPFNDDTDLKVKPEKNLQSNFTLDDIPKNELKALGIKFSELSAQDKQNLIKGKETKELSIKHNGVNVDAKLSLKRNEDNTVSLHFMPVQAVEIIQGIKM